MKINEEIEKMQSELVKVLKGCRLDNKEAAIQNLQEFGLDNDSAVKLLESFGDMQGAKRVAENVWNAALQSRSGVDFSTDIDKSSNTEVRMTRIFNGVNSKCALLMVAKTIDPNEINDEILDKLYEEGIQEHEITNPALKTTFHYYSESKAKDKEMTLKRTMDATLVDSLNNQLKSIEDKYATLRNDYNILQSNYEKLQNKFKERIALAEKHYQAALSQISTLKDKIGQLQDRGIFRTIGDKLTGLFGNKRSELPEATSKIPDTLYESSSEKMGLRVPGEEDLTRTYMEKDHMRTPSVDRPGADEWQQG